MDLENIKLQYIFDKLQLESTRRLNVVYQRSCEDRNNLLLSIGWLSITIPVWLQNYYYKEMK